MCVCACVRVCVFLRASNLNHIDGSNLHIYNNKHFINETIQPLLITDRTLIMTMAAITILLMLLTEP